MPNMVVQYDVMTQQAKRISSLDALLHRPDLKFITWIMR